MRTSANINISIANQIKELSITKNISQSQIIITMLDYIIPRINSQQVEKQLTEYQIRAKGLYTKVDYIPDDILCDKLGFIRWFYRVSISMIISVCYLLFWDKILDIFEPKRKIKEHLLFNYEQIIKISSNLINYYSNRFQIIKFYQLE